MLLNEKVAIVTGGAKGMGSGMKPEGRNTAVSLENNGALSPEGSH